MKFGPLSLRARLLLYGAVLPALLLGASVGVGGELFARALLEAIDRSLTTQGAVEAVSLFDGPTGEPHIHVGRTRLPHWQSEGPALTALYREDGTIVVQYPENARVPEHMSPDTLPESMQPTSRVRAGGERFREIAIRVRQDTGEIYALWLGRSMDRYDATLSAYYRTVGLTVAVIALLLFGIQLVQARSLAGRIQHLAEHMQRVEQGDLTSMPKADANVDVIRSLRDSIASATRRLGDLHAAQDRLMAGAAHELRTPLATMRADIDITLRRERPADELREALERTRHEVDRLARLATELLDLTAIRQTDLRRAATDLVALASEAVRSKRPEALARQVRLELSAPEALSACVDPDAVRQALDNLLSNAIKFSPEGGTVTLTLSAARGEVRVSVRDEGAGVDPAEFARIFEPFYRADPSRSGKGLGLAIVRDIATKHGGRVFVDAAAKPGATFHLELPDREARDVGTAQVTGD